MDDIYKIPIREFKKSNITPIKGMVFSYMYKREKIFIKVVRIEDNFVFAKKV